MSGNPWPLPPQPPLPAPPPDAPRPLPGSDGDVKRDEGHE
jgi:hypothetical protein